MKGTIGSRLRRGVCCARHVGGIGLWLSVAVAARAGQTQVPATPADFQMRGTQPLTPMASLLTSNTCLTCHGDFSTNGTDPGFAWRGSMHGQAARDVLTIAARAIANQDVAGAGEICIRCHSPLGWLGGRSTPPDGSALTASDLDGVTCHVCHRLVNPFQTNSTGFAPPDDQAIIADLATSGLIPVNPGNAQYVIDPQDRRRGPFGDLPSYPDNFPYHDWRESPYHRASLLCGTCHDVSNPVLERQMDNSYAVGTLGLPHATQDKHDMFPEQRTFTEWALSDFAAGPIEMGGRFGGNKTAVSTCQDCHMPDVSGVACRPQFGPISRTDLPLHTFAGANTWMHDALRIIEGAGIDPKLDASLQNGKAANIAMLQAAASMTVVQSNGVLDVRVTNETGHKLPTAYPEGRRMWLNVRFFDSNGTTIEERGAYDAVTADLTADTKVYAVEMGFDASIAGLTGLAAGPSFHLVLNNTIEMDNRIPPRGFTNAAFDAVHIAPVGYSYADGQYWDDSSFLIPLGAVSAEVKLKYQTTSKEYIEFLRDANSTGVEGQEAYDLWVAAGKSAPVTMVATTNGLGAFAAGDGDGDGDVDLADYALMQQCWGATGPPPCDQYDTNIDGWVDETDLATFEQRLAGPQ